MVLSEKGRDLTARSAEASQAIVRMVAEGDPLDDVLEAIAELVEHQAPGALVAVMRLDVEGALLRLAAGPSLPRAFAGRIDGVHLDQNAGSCVAAARTRASVIVADIESDPRWADARSLAKRWGFRSCWSTPVISTRANVVLGTLALYWRELRLPTTDHIGVMADAAGLVTMALERSRIDGELAFQAYHDELTKLPNRALLQDRLVQALARRRRQVDAGDLALLSLDIDHFARVNAAMGHAGGDALLVAVGERLRSSMREIDTVARIGGDEFVILAHTDDAEVLAGRIHEAMTASFDVGKGVRVSCSMGVAVAGDAEPATSLLQRAEQARDAAKAQGRNAVVVDHLAPARDRLTPTED